VARIFQKDGMTATVGATARAEAVVAKTIALQVHAFRLALGRLEAAIEATLADDVYIALTEATYWLASVAETDKSLKTDGDVLAVTFVRDRLFHQTASPTYLDDDGVGSGGRPHSCRTTRRASRQQTR
jgi:hypothetical protein